MRDVDLAALGAGRSPGLTAYADPLLAVCTHGRHDACCAERGRPLAAALAASRHADAVWECSHIGGDRFAGNLLVLPRGLYYGRVDPDSALEVADAVADGRARRSTTCAAARTWRCRCRRRRSTVRRRLGLAGLDDVRPTAARTDGDLTTVDLDAGGRSVTVRVRRVLEAPQRLTCGARRDDPVPRFEVDAGD